MFSSKLNGYRPIKDDTKQDAKSDSDSGERGSSARRCLHIAQHHPGISVAILTLFLVANVILFAYSMVNLQNIQNSHETDAKSRYLHNELNLDFKKTSSYCA